jgi:hypothetical protein
MLNGYSVKVKTIIDGKETRFEPYRGPDSKAAHKAYLQAADRLKTGEVVLWLLTPLSGKPQLAIRKPAVPNPIT